MSTHTLYTHSYQSPIGELHLAVDRFGTLHRLSFVPLDEWGEERHTEVNKYACGEAEYQLDQYFSGERRRFNLEVALEGTPFQMTVWTRLMKVQYGDTLSYGTLARKIGRREAARAVGNAVAANPIPIIIPCHRVIPSSGGIGSYAKRSVEDGVTMKETLLRLEGALERIVAA